MGHASATEQSKPVGYVVKTALPGGRASAGPVSVTQGSLGQSASGRSRMLSAYRAEIIAAGTDLASMERAPVTWAGC